MSLVKAIGFDLFNTLITVEPHALQVALARLVDSLAQNDLRVDREAFAFAHRQAAIAHVEQTRVDGRETHNRFWISSALAQLGIQVDSDDPRIGQAVEVYFSGFFELSHLIPDTKSTLEALRPHYRLGLLSNFTHGPAARAILDQLELTPLFEVVVISGELGYRKPHDRAFQALSEGLNQERANILYVGDDPECDVHGARDAGLQPVWTTWVRDRNISVAPGIPAHRTEPIDGGTPRISEWKDLLIHLENRNQKARPPISNSRNL